MSKIKPHPVFETIRADEVAECWDISRSLYDALWTKVVQYQKPTPNLEDSGPYDHVGHENLAGNWHRLSKSEQDELNAIAQKWEA